MKYFNLGTKSFLLILLINSCSYSQPVDYVTGMLEEKAFNYVFESILKEELEDYKIYCNNVICKNSEPFVLMSEIDSTRNTNSEIGDIILYNQSYEKEPRVSKVEFEQFQFIAWREFLQIKEEAIFVHLNWNISSSNEKMVLVEFFNNQEPNKLFLYYIFFDKNNNIKSFEDGDTFFPDAEEVGISFFFPPCMEAE